MNLTTLAVLTLTGALLVYLVAALLFPEKF